MDTLLQEPDMTEHGDDTRVSPAEGLFLFVYDVTDAMPLEETVNFF